MLRTRTLITTAVAVAIVALLAWSFRPQPVPADIVASDVGPVTVAIREQARTRVKDRFEISAPMIGYAPRLEWEVGDRVRAGDVLLELEPVPASVLDPRSLESAQAEVARSEAAVRAAEAALQAARTAAELAGNEYRRLEPLYERGTISESELDRARARYNQAQAELRSAESNVDVARQSLRYARAALVQGTGNGPEERGAFPIEAPVDGRILAVAHESAGVVQPSEPLLEIGDPASLEVVAELLTADAVRVRPGTPVELTRWGGDETLQAEVRRVEPSAFTKVSALGVEEQRTNVVIDLVSPRERWSALGHGFRVEARFILWRRDDALRVPNGAVFDHLGRPTVFVVADGRARAVPIVVERRGEAFTAVERGLEPGTAVIAYPDSEIGEGTRVTPFRALSD